MKKASELYNWKLTILRSFKLSETEEGFLIHARPPEVEWNHAF